MKESRYRYGRKIEGTVAAEEFVQLRYIATIAAASGVGVLEIVSCSVTI